MSGTSAATGAIGEDAAVRHYLERGYEVLARNWRCRVGELDVVAAREGVLVFCEVKSRTGAGFGAGWEAVTARKRAKLRNVAEAFLIAHPWLRSGASRFDVASVVVRGSVARVEVFEDAF